mgnify:CR=1 FL=1
MKEKSKLCLVSKHKKEFVPREQRFPYGTRVALGVQNDHQKNMSVSLSTAPWEKKTNENKL